MAKQITVQSYPRIENATAFNGFIDDAKLVKHTKRIATITLKEIIQSAIKYANVKSSRVLLNIPADSDDATVLKHHNKAGKDLFLYFKKYFGDPASSAFDCLGKHYSVIAKEQFRNRTIQKERMNAGWRYQAIAKDAAIKSRRFNSVSDIGTAEADFNAVIKEEDSNRLITIYVSVKNRTNTMGGQDWPKAIRALEEVAKGDKNRQGPYICVFGIAMDKGFRNIRLEGKTKQPYSFNTEVWLSDFFWPFFANASYDEIIKAVLQILIENEEKSSLDFELPYDVIAAFGKICNENPYRLVDLFCGKLKAK